MPTPATTSEPTEPTDLPWSGWSDVDSALWSLLESPAEDAAFPLEPLSLPGSFPVPGAFPLEDGLSSLIPYRYEALAPGSWIRVLTLKPGSACDMLSCALQTILLEDAIGNYDTLSYVWGPVQPLVRILVDGCYMDVRRNLAEFLFVLRSSTVSLTLWADALCINQQSVEEKNHQVQQMHNIYRYSHITRVWLGSSINISRSIPLPFSRSPIFSERVSAEDVITEILNAPYWNRLWIIQEIILSTNIEVYAKTVHHPWADFVQFCKEEAGPVLERLSKSTLLNLHRQRGSRGERRLPELVERYSACLCFDLRDRLFGLLSLASDFQFTVDYGLSALQIFERVMRQYPVQFAEDLGAHLAAALELTPESIVCEPETARSASKIPLRARDCGPLIWHASSGKLIWEKHPEHVVILASHFQNLISAEDSLYSLSSAPLPVMCGTPHLMVVVRGSGTRCESTCNVHNPKIINYVVTGVALVLHSSDDIQQHMGFDSDNMSSDLRAFRFDKCESLSAGPLIIEMTILCFLRLQTMYGFRKVGSIPTYDVFVNGGYDRSRFESAKNGDDDDQPQAHLIGVAEG